MLTATDSFVEYLAANVTSVPIHWRRQTAIDENATLPRMDALNVQFLGFFEEGSSEFCLVSLDLLGVEERTVLAQLKEVRDVLLAAQITPELDYTNPSLPAATGRAVSWEGREIRFLNVRVPKGARYVHYNATFPLLHVRE